MEWKGRIYKTYSDINAEDLINLLTLWEEKKIKAVEVMLFGEEVFDDLCDKRWPEPEKSSKEYFLISVIELLERLYTNPILPEDIPILKKTLLISQGDPTEADRMLDDYFDKIEWEERLKYVGPAYPE